MMLIIIIEAFTFIIIGSSGSVQLRGGVVPEAGTVEYCSGGTWKAVCHSNWYYQNAFVVCRQLGFPATGMCITKLIFYNSSLYYGNTIMFM